MNRTIATYRHLLLLPGLALIIGIMRETAGAGNEVPLSADERAVTRTVDEAMEQGLTAEDFPAEEADVFAGMDGTAPAEDGSHRRLELSGDAIKGRNTWMMWCGGNEAFWDYMARYSYGLMDLLKLVDSRQRHTRFKTAGLMNQPGYRRAEKPDAYGLWLDEPGPEGSEPGEVNPKVYGRPTGVLGLRLFPNPEFKGEAVTRWNAGRYYGDPAYYKDPALIRPYRVGMSCAFCHVGPHPLYPPADPEQPKWENLSAVIGAQYFRTSAVFGNLLPQDSFVRALLDSQLPGTIDTSLVATDHINNPNTMNAIFQVPARLHRALENTPEKQGAGGLGMPHQPPVGAHSDPRHTPRVLLDGADSIGVWGALARVYLNIGTHHRQWIECVNPVVGFRPQKTFHITDLQENSVYWKATEYRIPYLAAYFLEPKTTAPMKLADALRANPAAVSGIDEEQQKRLRLALPEVRKQGARIFAEHCAMCHSSKQPPGFGGQTWKDSGDLKEWKASEAGKSHAAWMKTQMGTEAGDYEAKITLFLSDNYLSTDTRHPVTLIGTNAARASATNAMKGHVWADFSSDDYQKLPSVGAVPFWNPYKELAENGTRWNDTYTIPGGGPGYYRPASLVSLWATAPYLHNNSVGKYKADPSLAGRVEAFYDGIGLMLAGENGRAPAGGYGGGDPGLVFRTTQPTWIRIDRRYLPHAASGLLHGMDYGWLGAVFRYPWLPGAVLIFLAGISLRSSKRWKRVFGVLGVLGGTGLLILGYFVAGKLTDVEIGPIPQGTPVNLLANLDPAGAALPPADADDGQAADYERKRKQLGKTLRSLLKALKKIKADNLKGDAAVKVLKEEVAPEVIKTSTCPDFIIDRGHNFGADLTQPEKDALIEFLKTL